MLMFCSTLVLAETVFTEGFESGWGSWYTDNGVWEVGTPTAGPQSSHGGSKCAATVLGGNYPAQTKSRLISPSIMLPSIGANEEIHLRFWQWFSFGGGSVMGPDTYGYVQIMTYDSSAGTWSSWTDVSKVGSVSSELVYGLSSVWSPMDVDLTAYANKKIKIGFYLLPYYDTSLGWYIDDISIEKKYPSLSGDFEKGWGDWSADNGVWEVGTPTAGPQSSHGGSKCAATVLGGNYPAYTVSRLISPSIMLPSIGANEEIHLRFWQWFSFGGGSVCCPDTYGYVQIMTYDSSAGTWSSWIELKKVGGLSSVWSPMDVDLTAYANKKIKIGFYLLPYINTALGWYIDDITIDGVLPPTSTACTATLDGNFSLHIPYLSYVNPIFENLSLWADFDYEFNPTYPTLILFKYKNSGIITNPSFSCEASTLTYDLKIGIPDVLLPDKTTHLWVDLEYSPALSTDANAYFLVTHYDAVSN
jgi:hypothetical protein